MHAHFGAMDEIQIHFYGGHAERAKFCEYARSFQPMFLEECDGLLEFRKNGK